MASERIVVQVTPTQKKEIAAIAKRVGLNTSELMRQAVRQFQSLENEQHLEALLRQVQQSTQEAEHALDQALISIDQSNQRIKQLSDRSH